MNMYKIKTFKCLIKLYNKIFHFICPAPVGAHFVIWFVIG